IRSAGRYIEEPLRPITLARMPRIAEFAPQSPAETQENVARSVDSRGRPCYSAPALDGTHEGFVDINVAVPVTFYGAYRMAQTGTWGKSTAPDLRSGARPHGWSQPIRRN